MLKKLLFSLVIGISLLTFSNSVLASFDYTPMESIPGFSTTDGNFCNYIVAVYKFGLWVIGICAMFMIMIGGYMYLVSGGNTASMGKAKGIIVDAIVGLLLALSAYLIVYVINPDLVQIKGICDTQSGGGNDGDVDADDGDNDGDVDGNGNDNNIDSAKEKANRQTLKDAGINVNRPNACTASKPTNCTDTGGLKDSTIQGLTDLKKECPECPMTVTGGSEGGHSSRTQYSHGNGYKADLQLNPTLNAHIEKNYTPAGTRSDGATLYKDSKGNIYAKEKDHWDVCYNCK
jgi:hypothetical protein